jgi:hypothetical protein
MAAILQFEKHNKADKPAVQFEAGQSAKILMFTGVRFERIDFAALKDTLHLNAPARAAN